MKGPRWTSDEDEHLLELVDNGFTDAEIGRIVGRGETAIRCRRLKLGDWREPSMRRETVAAAAIWKGVSFA